MKKIKVLMLLIFSLSVFSSYAIKDSIDFSVDVVSRYMWRGFDLGGPGLQPAVKWIMAGNDNHTLEIEGWSYSEFKGNTNEIDLTLTYKLLKNRLEVSLHDYCYVSGKDMEFFDYDNQSTAHTIGLMLNYTHDLTPKQKLRFRWSSILYGNDKKVDSNGERINEQAYSGYFELKYKGSIMSDRFGLEAYAGVAPWKSPYYYEVDKFSVINLGLGINREFSLGNNVYMIPSVLFTVNPKHENVYMSVGVSTLF